MAPRRTPPVALAPALALLMVLPGCLTEPAPPEPAATTAPTGVQIVDDRPDTSFNEVATGPAAGPDLNATLAAPPRLVAGEWWRLRFDTPLLGDQPVSEVVRVVAAVEPDGYLIGMPHEGWYKEAIAYHAPAFGDVALDLSYNTHNVRFTPLRFPITEGDTWETAFATSPLIATVEEVEGSKAVVVFRSAAEPQPTDPLMVALGMSADVFMRLTYDATAHEVIRFESGIGTWEMVEHGYGYEGWVTIPRGEHTAIDYGQIGPVTPGQPVVTRSIPVEGGFNRMTLMHLIFPLAPGAYRIRSVAPDGTEYLTEMTGSDLTVRFYEATSPDGTWTGEDVVAGAGGTYSMGIAYHQYDIRLPDGARRSDHSHPVVR